MQKVLFTSTEVESLQAESTLPAKFRRALYSLELKNKVNNKNVVIKMHVVII